ncbi:MAG: polysaccharide deacetylase family protein [Acidobacteriaceae bacterium]
MRPFTRSLLVVACGMLLAAHLRQACARPSVAAAHLPPAKVALTVDDLPTTDDRPAHLSRAHIARSILHALKKAGSPPVYGFVNAGQLEDGPADIRILKMWRAARFPLGNHTYSHMDLGAHTAAEFEQDIAKDEPVLQQQMGSQDWHWFRYPYLQEGDTLEKREEVRAWLAAHHYRIAEVSLSFDDWAWNDPYARCVAHHDTASIRWLKSSYLSSATESLAAGREMSNAIYGRDIQYVMLLHIGGFETVMLPHLMTLLKQKDFSMVPLDQAESDPAYLDDPRIALKYGGTFLEMMMLAKHLPSISHPQTPMRRLNSICTRPIPSRQR